MRGSSLTTFLVFLPLIAIPVLAVFGIPEFQPVNASSPTEVGAGGVTIRDLESAADPETPGESKAPARAFSDDVFKSPDMPKSFDAPPGSTNDDSNDPFLNERKPVSPKASPRMKGWELDPRRYTDPRPNNGAGKIRLPERKPRPRREPAPRKTESRREAAPFPGMARAGDNGEKSLVATALKRKPEPRKSAMPTTLQSIVARLQELGIRDYVLRPGTRNCEFYFRCNTSPRGRNSISVKFEDEDTDPLRAAQKVLAQVEARRGVY